MSDKLIEIVEFWINDDDTLCFFDDNQVLKIHDWRRLAHFLMHELASGNTSCYGQLGELQEVLGRFGERDEQPTDEGTSP